MRAQVHYELFVRHRPGGQWALDMATEDRKIAVDAAEELFSEGKVAAVRVTKETLDPETREFQSVAILNKGATEPVKKKKPTEDLAPLCVAPQDLYSAHARDRIGRLLEGWLARHHATPFELLHRPDLVEELDASGIELQHAIQKIAVPEAQERGLSVHELMRVFQSLAERAIQRLLKDARRGVLPDIDKEGFAKAAERVAREPDRAYLLGAGVAASIAPARGWSDKVNWLLDLADAAPTQGPPRALALNTIEQPLAEILGSSAGIENVLGRDLDLGARLAAMTRMAASDSVEMLIRMEASVARIMPPLSAPAERLSRWLCTDDFQDVRRALVRRVVRELTGPRRLRPDDAEGEILILRGLAMALTAAAGSGANAIMPLEDVQAAFAARSKMLVTSDFVESYLGREKTAVEEVQALIWLVENVIGGASKREACRWVGAVVSSLRFEKELSQGPMTPAVRLLTLSSLQHGVARAGLAPGDYQAIQLKLGELGGRIEADAKLIAQIVKAPAPGVHRLVLLLKLAMGEAGPIGPASERARIEAIRLMRQDEVRAELVAAPERFNQVRDMMAAAGMAA